MSEEKTEAPEAEAPAAEAAPAPVRTTPREYAVLHELEPWQLAAIVAVARLTGADEPIDPAALDAAVATLKTMSLGG
jgi:hypothetical protein